VNIPKENEYADEHDRNRDDQDVDDESQHPPRHHPLEQVGARNRIVGMRFDFEAVAATRWLVGHG
jgi:hypothetical protein